MRRRSPALIAIALALALTPAAGAATRYAEPGGKGPAAKCPKSKPCDVQVAVEGAEAGDQVSLAPGTYATAADEILVDEAITVRGADKGPLPRILAEGGGFAVRVTSPGAELRDFQIEQLGGATAMALFEGEADRMTVSSSGVGACTALGGALIRNSFCLGEGGASGFMIDAGAGADFTPKLRNVTAVAADSGPTAYGIRMGVGSGGRVALDALNVIASGPADDVFAGTDGVAGSSAGAALDHSNFSTTSVAGAGASVTPPTEAGNQNDEPLLANVGKGDLHQKAGSPTIDGGASGADIGSTDIDGEQREQGAAPDIGADEIDSEVTGAKVTARKSQDQGGSTVRILFKAGAKEPVSIRAKGSVVVGSKAFALEPKASRARGRPKAMQLQLDKGDARKVLSALDSGKPAEAKLVVTFKDDADNTLRVKRSVELK